ncbi:LIM homeobox 1 [Caligus rogercresseyi]|uniref:LIM homeobox 1 n=1 Tax=Caligus rogercresseyi TaxID=217165 RepID=A0A7T8H247_CALRO|nr:LIM homeobox 1 [Caligus rogercresseyi]
MIQVKAACRAVAAQGGVVIVLHLMFGVGVREWVERVSEPGVEWGGVGCPRRLGMGTESSNTPWSSSSSEKRSSNEERK